MAGTVLITGANGTLALEFVRSLLTLHPEYTILAAVRNPSTQEDPNTAKLAQIVAKHPKSRFLVQRLDLGSLDNVRSFTASVSRQVNNGELPRISAIVCNAMTWSLESGQKFTADKLEATFQICHLSHHLLVLKLLESMDKTSGRIVMLGSVVHYPEKPNPLSKFRPGFPSDMDQLVKPLPDGPGEEHDRGYARYGSAKLANVVFMHDLNRRLEANAALAKITVTAMDPGGLPASRSQVGQKKPIQFMMAIINLLMPLLKHLTTALRPAADAARDLVAVSVEPEFQGRRGYFVGRSPEVDAEISRSREAQESLWAACWRWTGLRAGDTMLE
ncbi:NAD(P)-binding protein [Lophiostoma macrostomum CBS 122681]|uniref:3beta-hydroxysteroid 3-dehydrogenase n=1 Tax=Lophiostoma macrostomum CBS 122681 TaxID=1314788 RepID=A0A6A6SV55_9PLEO|nr:NAD(P)-binding protein [Lophiostoma macrostomum CBS 122681]